MLITKPRSSRTSSIESFVVCRLYRPPENYVPTMLNPLIDEMCEKYFQCLEAEPNRSIIPFVACGDLNGYDPDKNYPLDLKRTGTAETSSYVYREPTQAPIHPPYERACQLKKNTAAFDKESSLWLFFLSSLYVLIPFNALIRLFYSWLYIKFLILGMCLSLFHFNLSFLTNSSQLANMKSNQVCFPWNRSLCILDFSSSLRMALWHV